MFDLRNALVVSFGMCALLASGQVEDAVDAGQLLPGAVKALGAGKLLVAARGLPDPNFSESVILLADYSDQGAMGLIINRQTSVPVARLFRSLKPQSSSTLFAGGPVAADGVVGLLRSKTATADSRHVFADVYMIAKREPLESLIVSSASSRFRLYLGYAGWGPRQLEREVLLGSWHVFKAEADLVFDPDPASLWQRQIGRISERMAYRPSAFGRQPSAGLRPSAFQPSAFSLP
jgi:putative transcriptional regulator